MTHIYIYIYICIYTRPRIKHPRMKNVYRVGASIRPGNGVPLVMIGARLVAEQVLKDIQQEERQR